MELNQIILICLYASIGMYLLYKVFFRKNPYQAEYERMYNEILTSKKYRVKGQFDRD
ncbi:hypothetical protein HYS31_05915 [Candidatus Woesearchaeota archaeon]|nr:hypothetical protein [Candidatus Woesearchaeota archaeon]